MGVDEARSKAGFLCSEKSRDITQPYPRGSGIPRPTWKELPGIAKGMEVRERERGKGGGRERDRGLVREDRWTDRHTDITSLGQFFKM